MKANTTHRHEQSQSVDEKLFTLLISTVRDYAIFMIDPEGFILSWNKGAQHIKGYREAEIIGKHISVFYTAKEIADNEPLHNLSEALKKGSFEKEGWRVRKNGSVFWAHIVFTPLYDEKGKLFGFAKVTRDMTEQKMISDQKERQNIELERRVKENTEQIIRNERRFRALIDNSYDGISLLDENLHTFYRSPSAERINGWDNAEREKHETADLVHPDDREYLTKTFADVKTQPGKSILSTYRVKQRRGHFIWIECVFTNMLADEAIRAIVCNFRDITEKKNAEEALQRTVKELSDYKYALDQAALIAITDQNGIITYANPLFCKQSKYSAEELVGQDHRLISSGYHTKSFIKNFWTTIKSGNIWKGEFKNKTKDGIEYWVDATIVPFLDDKGKPYQYLAIRTDITERKLSQEKIAESEHLIKTVTDNIPAMVAYWSGELVCLFANKMTLDFLGKQADEMIGASGRWLLDRRVPGSEMIKSHVEKVLKGEEQIFEYHTPAGAGRSRFFKMHYLPDLQNGVVHGYFSFTYDITDIKEAEQLVKSKTEQIENILERITDGFMTLDNNLCFTYVNKQFGKMTGNSPEAMIGKYIWDVFPAATANVKTGFNRALREQCYVTLEDYYEPLDLWAEDHLYPSEGGVSAFIRDITVRKRAEREIQLLNEGLERKVAQRTLQLEAANKELEAFSYSVSHDLRTPLRAVGGFSMMLKDGYETMSPADRTRIVNIISNNATLMGQLIDDLLEFSKLGRKEVKFITVDIQAMVRGCIGELTYDIDKIYDFKIRELPVCDVDSSMIKQVWINLLGNAMKYSSKMDKPVIEVGAKVDKNQITYYVKDNGVGFDMKYAGKLFGVFQRLHRKDEFEGTGVGLALVKRIIDRHHGRLWAEAKPGRGATFFFSLPLTQISS